MKNILFVLHYPPPVHGAAMVGEYVRQSKKINSVFKTEYINLSTSQALGEIGKGGLIKLCRFLTIFWRVFKSLKNFKPDLVYVTLNSGGYGFLKDSLIVFLIKALSNKRIVYHMHNTGVQRYQNKFLYDFLYKKIFNNASVILISKYLIEDVKKYVRKEDIKICANGIPKIFYNKSVGENHEVNNIPNILFLSNLIEAKGVYILLDACRVLKSKNIQFTCTYIGSEGDITSESLINKIKSLNLENEVMYLGPKYGEEKYSAYSNADIFVFPTFYKNETFGLVNVEAMQFSIPIISTNIGGIPDVVKDGFSGFLVETKNELAVANKLEILIEDKELRLKMGKNGYENYNKQFTIEIFENRLTTILLELLN